MPQRPQSHNGIEAHCSTMRFAQFRTALRIDAMPETCPYCNGNDHEAACAYPDERKPGCLRDKRLSEADFPEWSKWVRESLNEPSEKSRAEF
jgi:hypothetical protein